MKSFYNQQIPYIEKHGFRICECEKCGTPLVATWKDAQQLTAIFDYQIKQRNTVKYRIKKKIIETLGGSI